MTSPTPPPGDSPALDAVLRQLSDHAERLGKSEERWRQAGGHLSTMGRQVEGLAGGAEDQAAVLEAIKAELGALSGAVQALITADEAGQRGYHPLPTVRWWELTAEQRAEEVARLSDWLTGIFLPGYGELAKQVPHCWEQHPACLLTLDWLNQLWCALFLQPKRNASLLSAQAEWQTRVMPAAVEQMATEGKSCAHLRPATTRRAGTR